MTKEEILAMVPGRELDALVAERVMLLKVNAKNGAFSVISDIGRSGLKRYSNDISAAWEVVERMRERIFSKRRIFLDNLQELTRYIGTIDRPVAWPDVFWFVNPESICKAALLAVMEAAHEPS